MSSVSNHLILNHLILNHLIPYGLAQQYPVHTACAAERFDISLPPCYLIPRIRLLFPAKRFNFSHRPRRLVLYILVQQTRRQSDTRALHAIWYGVPTTLTSHSVEWGWFDFPRVANTDNRLLYYATNRTFLCQLTSFVFFFTKMQLF